MADSDDIECRVMTKDDITAVWKATDEFFLQQEPITMQLGMTQKERDIFTAKVLPHALASGLTILAIEKVSGDIVGIRLSLLEKKGEPDKLQFDVRNPDERKAFLLFDVLHNVSNNVNVFEEYHVAKVMHFMGVAVDPRHYGKGIGKKMIEKSIEVALQQGIHIAFVEATSCYSRRIFDKMGFRLLSKFTYAGYAWDDEIGKVTLGKMEPHVFLSLHVLKF